MKILFIQHASGFGGSAMSLQYTLQGIKLYAGDKYKVVVALAKWTKPLSDFYEQAGFEVVKPDWIDTYEHTQGVHFNLLNPFHFFKEIIQSIRIKKALGNTEKLIDLVNPDIVHLNSVVLLGSAFAVKRKKIPLVWHVREPAVKGLFGFRRALIKKSLRTIPNKVIFICKADMESWGNPTNGMVIYNFVDFEKFDFNLIKSTQIEGVKIPTGDLNILFLGAVGRIKGGLYLIKAVNKLMENYPDKKIQLLFPGSIYDAPKYFIYKLVTTILPLFGQGTYAQKIEKEISNSPHPENFIKFRFVKDVPQLLASCDILVFPSIRPHFARPIIEAGAMSKPVVGSRLGGVEELILDNENGFLVKPKSVKEIETKLEYFLNHKVECKKMGEKGYAIAQNKYESKENVSAIIKVYEGLTIPY
ncbi:MAG: glycosyltransferase family 4 protein [Flavobacteriaceae bacterium]|nr:glycosyltransferase family 4 protein [Flavobacteriaceae bacterium]